jgi:glycosyltransferase involved in cell wall biosynthesis
MPAKESKSLVMIGAFSTEGKFLGGESVKNNLLADEFARRGVSVTRVDTAGWRGRPIEVARDLLRAVAGGDRTVFLCSAAPGASIALPPLVALKAVFRFRLVYLVVGYKILDFVARRPDLVWFLKRLDEIYLETGGMRRDLSGFGLRNVTHIPNFRTQVAAEARTSPPAKGQPLRVVFFSRIVETKGADIAVEAVRELNRTRPGRGMILDIYGSAQPGDQTRLERMIGEDPAISYRGKLASDAIPSTLARYHFMLFPSRYEGEVFPGAVLEAHAVGLPVLISDWHYNAECVEDGETGFVLPVRDVEAWTGKLEELRQLSRSDYMDMSRRCVANLERYSPDQVMGRLLEAVFRS